MNSPPSLQKASLQKKIKELKKVLKYERMSKEYLFKRCQILELIIKNHCPQFLPPQGVIAQERFIAEYNKMNSEDSEEFVPEYSNPKSIHNYLIAEIQKNSKVPPNGRRWSHIMITFSTIIYMLSSKSYEYMRKILPLPHKKTIHHYFQPTLENWKLSIVNLTHIQNILKHFREKNGLSLSETVDVVLGIDAMSMENCPEEQDSNHAFMFLMMPLSCRYKSITIHVMPLNKGNADLIVKERIQVIINILQENYFNVLYFASDGDPGYQSMHNEAHKKWFNMYIKKGLEQAIQMINGNGWPITDFLHVLKNSRSRILKGNVSLRVDGGNIIDYQKMNDILQLGKPLTDKSTIGKMKDSYPLQIFTLENLIELLKHDAYEYALYILPYSFWCEAVRNPVILPQMRLEILEFILNIFTYFLTNVSFLEPGVKQNNLEGSIQYF